MNKVKQFLRVTGMLDLPSSEAINRQRSQLVEELHEFWQAWDKHDRLEMLDAVADIQFVEESLYELGWHIGDVDGNHIVTRKVITKIYKYCGFDSDVIVEAFERVCDNNLSKFDATLEDALETRTKYDRTNHKTQFYAIGGLYVTKSLEEDTYGKILKSHKFVPVSLGGLLC